MKHGLLANGLFSSGELKSAWRMWLIPYVFFFNVRITRNLKLEFLCFWTVITE